MKQAFPISASSLQTWVERVDWSKPLDFTFWCLCLFGFFLMARNPVLVFSTSSGVDPRMIIRRGDFRGTPFGLAVSFRMTVLTRQFGGQGLMVPLTFHLDARLCPVTVFRLLENLVPAPRRQWPLFTLGWPFLLPTEKGYYTSRPPFAGWARILPGISHTALEERGGACLSGGGSS